MNTILITGASSGIGQRLAQDYLAQGHRVYCCGRNAEALQTLKRQYPESALLLSFDICDWAACQKALTDIEELDLVILNAGTCEYIDAPNFDAQSFERVVQTNLVGVANCLQPLIPAIKSGGRLALVGSSSSYLPLPRAEAYGASKAAIEYLADTLSISLRTQNIGVSYIAPGFVETPLTARNDFPMPMQVSVEQAATAITNGLAKGQREIHFPKAFTYLLKFIGALPTAWREWVVRKTVISS